MGLSSKGLRALRKKGVVAPKPEAKASKYHIGAAEKRTEDGIVFDSQLEMRVYRVFRDALGATSFTRQDEFELQPRFRMVTDGAVRRRLIYRSDFVLGPLAGDGSPGAGAVVVDAKGMRTPDFNLKKLWFEARYGSPLRLVRNMREAAELAEEFKHNMSAITELGGSEMLDEIAAGRRFRIRNYRTSEGRVSDLSLRIVGVDGYEALLRASLADLADGPQLDALDEDRREAVLAVAAGLNKSLDTLEGHGPSGSDRVSHEELNHVAPNIALKVDGDQRAWCLFRLEVDDEEVHEEGRVAKSRNKLSQLKKELRASLPIARFRFRINLEDGKYERIELL